MNPGPGNQDGQTAAAAPGSAAGMRAGLARAALLGFAAGCVGIVTLLILLVIVGIAFMQAPLEPSPAGRFGRFVNQMAIPSGLGLVLAASVVIAARRRGSTMRWWGCLAATFVASLVCGGVASLVVSDNANLATMMVPFLAAMLGAVVACGAVAGYDAKRLVGFALPASGLGVACVLSGYAMFSSALRGQGLAFMLLALLLPGFYFAAFHMMLELRWQAKERVEAGRAAGDRTALLAEALLYVVVIVLPITFAALSEAALDRMAGVRSLVVGRDLAPLRARLEEEPELANEATTMGRTPLHLAAQFGSVEAMNILLEFGAEPGARDDYDKTPLHAAAEAGSLEKTKALLDRGADAGAADQFGSTPLHEACERNSVDVVSLLIDRGADVNASIGILKKSPLHVAARRGSESAAEILLQKGALPDAIDCDGRTPLHIAVEKNEAGVVRVLLAAGADPSVTGKRGRTAIDLAREKNRTRILQLLEASGRAAPTE